MSALPVTHTVVRASAGTGKTFRLTSHFLSLVMRGQDPSSILGSTFTRKAAGEILRRLLGRLAEAYTNPAKLEELGTSVGRMMTPDQAAAVLRLLTSRLDRLAIMTIDAFSIRAARSLALDLPASPAWTIADSARLDELRTQAVESVTSTLGPERLAEALRALHRGHLPRSAHMALHGLVNTARETLARTERARGPWEVVGPLTSANPMIDRVIEAFGNAEVPVTQAGAPRVRWISARDRVASTARAQGWRDVLESTLVERYFGNEPFDSSPFPPGFAAALEPLVAHAAHHVLEALRRRNLALSELLEALDDAYDATKHAAGALAFDDVPRMLLALGDRLDTLYFRLDARYRHILLDEFQDTSLAQFRMLEPMLDELLSSDEERSTLCVGDVKQSLYTWRGAEPGLLPRLKVRWPRLQEVPLATSFRSSPVILEALNTTFENLGNNRAMARFGEAAAGWSALYDHHEAHRKELRGEVRLRSGPGGDQHEARRGCFDAAVERVAELHIAAPGASIAVLLRRREPMGRIVKALRDRGIPASFEGGGPLTDSPPVLALLSMLHLADHPGDTAAYYHIAKSPLSKFLDLPGTPGRDRARECAAGLRRMLARDGVHDVLRRAVARVASSTDRAGVESLRKLLEQADAFEARGGESPSEFVQQIHQTNVDRPGPHRVRVMTIHASKGLEFDAVILPELTSAGYHARPPVLAEAPAREGEVASRVVLASAWPTAAERLVHGDLAAACEQADCGRLGESLCQLYVGMSRAIHSLDLIIPAGTHLGRDEKHFPTIPSQARIVLGALAPDRVPAAKHKVEPDSELCRVGDPTWMEGFRTALAPPTTRMITISLAKPPDRPATGRLARVAPSSLEGEEEIDLGDLLAPAARSGLAAGSLIHEWLAHIPWLDDGVPARESLLESPLARTATDLAAGCIERFCTSLGARFLGSVLSRGRYTGQPGTPEVLIERPFAVRLEGDSGPALTTGSFDRLVVWRDESGDALGAEVIDFKTDAPGTPAELTRRIDFYRPQLLAYRRAAAVLLGVPVEAVRATLVFVNLEREVDVR